MDAPMQALFAMPLAPAFPRPTLCKVLHALMVPQ